jgi:hypothetical protein
MRSAPGDRRFYVGIGALALLLSSAPYLYGWFHTPPGTVYTGLTYNIDDSCVYLSWMRQAENGRFFLHNQFSTDPQRGVLFNLLFLLLGNLVRLTRLPAIAIYHAARVLGGAGFLAAIVALLRETTECRGRRLAYAFVCFSAGIGWMWGGYVASHSYGQPVDVWQPEAISFLSLYFSPLFACALALMVVFLTSALRTERSGRLRDGIPAMVAGALLGNFHSYDVIHVFAVYFAYRVVRDSTARRLDLRGWFRFAVIGAATLPTTIYVYWATRVEPIFFQRAFISKTLSPALRWDLAGFGLPLALAAVYTLLVALRLRRAESVDAPPEPETNSGFAFLLTWAVVGVAVAYVPVAFQRKMLMGAHVPICLLAGSGLSTLTAGLSGDFPRIVAFFAVLLSAPSNALFMLRDIDRLSANVSSTSHRPYLTTAETDALTFLRTHAHPEDAVLVSPDASSQNRFPGHPLEPYLSVYVPALAGNVVYDGHWSETADYGQKLARARRFFRADTDDALRRQTLRDNDIRYVLVDNRLMAATPKFANGDPVVVADGAPYVPVAWTRTGPPPYLTVAYGNSDVTVYAVSSP